MGKLLQLIFDWSEVWALLIPLSVLLFRKTQPPYLRPVIIYLWAALFLNLSGDFIADFKKYLPDWLQSNNPLYNVHSIVRFACFAAFFVSLKQRHFTGIKKMLPILLLGFVLVNFAFYDYFFYYYNLSGNLLTAEAYLLLIYCLLYYLSQLKDDVETITGTADFWIATGLCIYVVVNFFVFLFYVPLLKEDYWLADRMWSVHNVAYILLCLFIARAFYVSARRQYSH